MTASPASRLRGILAHIGKTSWYKQGGSALPLFLHQPCFTTYRVWGPGSSIMVQSGGYNEAYFDKEKERREGEKYLAAFIRDPKSLKRRIAAWRRKAKEQQRALLRAETARDEDLAARMKAFCAATQDAWELALLIEPFDPWGHVLLRERVPETRITDEELSVLIAPRKRSFVERERADWLRVVRSCGKGLSAHAAKYRGLETSWQHSKKLDDAFFKRRLAGDRKRIEKLAKETAKTAARFAVLAKERARLLRTKKFSRGERAALEFFVRLNDWRDERKWEQVSRVNYGLMRIAERIAKRNRISSGLMMYAAPSELLSPVLPESYVKTLRRRAATAYVVWMNGSGATEWFYGTDAVRIRRRFEETFAVSFKELSGRPAYPGKVVGMVRIVNSIGDLGKMRKGDILVSVMTRPELAPGMKKAAAIVTDEGGITCHAAVIARELRVPCIVGTQVATHALADGDRVEVNADTGIVRKLKRV